MGYKELIEALKEDGERQIEHIRAEAQEKVNAIMKETESKIKDMGKAYEVRLIAEIEKRRGSILKEAEKEASRIRLTEQGKLSERLFSIARGLLRDLRDKDYREVFDALSGEIPDSKWVTVIVNPDDVELARSRFPDSKVIEDLSITGGFAVINSDGNVITNTFEKRLERLWPDLLPEIMKTIIKMYETPDR